MNTTDMLCLPRDRFEHELECMFERKTNALDRKYMSGKLSTKEYEDEVAALCRWADTMNATYDL